MDKAILYYTCNTHDPKMDDACRRQLSLSGLPIFSVSLNVPLHFGIKRLVMTGERSPLTMHKQVLYGLTHIPRGAVFLCESDVLYHPSHFDFTPASKGTYYYNTNVYKYWLDGHCVWTDGLQQISGLCADVDLLRVFFSVRIEQIEMEGWNRHYEPHRRYGCRTENYLSELPNLDIRHDRTLTRSHRSPDTYRNKANAKGFKVVDSVPFWGTMTEIEQRLEAE